jgi:tetratricopeptide (TPR) repeat protein
MAGISPIEQALRLHRAGRLEPAAALYRSILAERPDDFDALQLLGALCCDQGDPAAAIGLLETALVLRDDPAVRLNLGRAWHMRGRLDEAEQQFRLAAAAAPRLPQAHLFLGNLLKETGRPDAAIESFRRAVEVEPRYADGHFNLANALSRAGRHEAALPSYRNAAALRPDHLDTRIALGQTLQALGRIDEALAGYDAVLERAPEHGPALVLRADALAAAGRMAEAVEAYRRALRVMPDFAPGHSNLGVALQFLEQLDAALASFARATDLAPGLVQAWYSRGVVLHDLGRDAEAEASFRRALALAPDFADARTDLGLIELRRGDWAEGWRNYEWRWRARKFPGRLGPEDQPQWRGETPIAGRRIRLAGEQGLGDTLQFCRWVPALAALGAEIVLAVPSPLVTLLTGQFARVTVVDATAARAAVDLHCPLLSLASVLGLGPAGPSPYLSADPARRSLWRDRLGPAGGVEVGLVWSGNPAHRNDRNRSIPLTALVDLRLVPGARCCSVQKQTTAAERSLLAQSAIADFGADLGDFADTAGLVSELDLVITVDTSVAHLAGALGRPVWILLPAVADWRWGTGRADTPWYPTARLFRQTGEGWAPVLREVGAALAKFARARPIPIA